MTLRDAIDGILAGARGSAEPGPGYVWPPWDGPETSQPRSYAEADALVGIPAEHRRREDPQWKAANIVDCHGDGGKHPRLPGVPAKWYVAIHRRVEPYLREGLRRAAISAPEYAIERIGGYNWRTIRHRVGAPLSPHGLGIAVDVDPSRNRGIQFAKGDAPALWSDAWRATWPDGVPPAFVQAMMSCGFRWGSDWDEDSHSEDHDWQDPMHFEWVSGDGVRTLV